MNKKKIELTFYLGNILIYVCLNILAILLEFNYLIKIVFVLPIMLMIFIISLYFYKKYSFDKKQLINLIIINLIFVFWLFIGFPF